MRTWRIVNCRKSFLICSLIIGLAVVFGGSNVAFAEYPDRDIRVIIPYKPGGGSDVRARLVAEIIQSHEFLPKPWVITNIPGGGAAVGQESVLKAKPDGYTLLLHHGQMVAGNLLGVFDWTYTDFAPVAEITENPLLICTSAKSGFKTLDDVFEAAKEKPNQIRWAWGGMGGNTHFASEAIFDLTKLNFNAIALTGASEQKAALAGGHIDVAIMGIVPMDYIKSGLFVPLAVTSGERIALLPDVPTLSEKGINLEIAMRYSVFAPKGTPDEVLDILRKAIKNVTDTEEYKDKIESMGAMVMYKPGQEMLSQYKKDYDLYKSVLGRIKTVKAN